MKRLDWRDLGLNMANLAEFLSCFGLIDKLTIKLAASPLPADLDVQAYDDEILIFHARNVLIKLPVTGFPQLGSVLLATMSSCRSLRELRIISFFSSGNSRHLDTSYLITCAFMCSLKNPLRYFHYQDVFDLSQLKLMLPKLKLRPYRNAKYMYQQ
jgi:hypothetical protein